MKAIKTYSEFWPFYLREHSKAATRAWHYVGTGLAVALLVAGLLTGRWWLLPLMFVAGYFFAWVSHGLIEKNKPATFTYPFWSLISDFKMFFLFRDRANAERAKESRSLFEVRVAIDRVRLKRENLTSLIECLYGSTR